MRRLVNPQQATVLDHLDRLLPLVRTPRLEVRQAVEQVIAAVLGSVTNGAVFVGYLDYQRELFAIADAAGDGSFGLRPGLTIPIADSYCFHMADGRAPRFCNDTAHDPVYGSLAVQAALGCGSYLGVPLEWPDGSPFGSLCAVARSAYAFTAANRDLFIAASRVLSRTLYSRYADSTCAALGAALLGSPTAPDAHA
ncbi:MAG TPA: GAF domain-containing protein [Solirubrobacteraceae bacterium]|nr:GAF domain-containing protein [Solirubrobacteraceae bacterium]